MKTCLPLGLVCLILVSPGLCFAQPGDAPPASSSSASSEQEATEPTPEPVPTLEQARVSFLQGRKWLAEEKWKEAGEAFAYAARGKNTPGLRYYVAYCLEQQSRLLEALDEYGRASELLKSQPAADVERMIPEAIERVKLALPSLVVRGLAPGAQLFVDGQSIQVSDNLEPILVDPGAHQVVAKVAGAQDFARQVEALVGEALVVQVTHAPLAVPGAPAAASEASEARVQIAGRPVAIWTGVAVAALGVSVGAVGTGVFISGKNAEKEASEGIDELRLTDADFPEQSTCYQPSGELKSRCDELSQAQKRARTGRTVMIVGYSAAAAGATGALLSHFLWPKKELPVHVSAGPTGARISLRATF